VVGTSFNIWVLEHSRTILRPQMELLGIKNYDNISQPIEIVLHIEIFPMVQKSLSWILYLEVMPLAC
jgi:hypothetical protein